MDPTIFIFRTHDLSISNSLMFEVGSGKDMSTLYLHWIAVDHSQVQGTTFQQAINTDCYIMHGNCVLIHYKGGHARILGFMNRGSTISDTVAKIACLHPPSGGSGTVKYVNIFDIKLPRDYTVNLTFFDNVDDIQPDDWPKCFLLLDKSYNLSEAIDISKFLADFKKSLTGKTDQIINNDPQLISVRKLGFDLNLLTL